MFNGLSITFNPVLAALMSARIVPSFDPLTLFAAGEPGVWYDPSDFSTMFQDAAGTTPVTAVEQPVGLILDKSKGLVLGPELVTNGDFSGGTTGWTASGTATPTLSVESGELRVSIASAASQIRAVQPLTLVVGKIYKVTGITRRVIGDNTFLRVTTASDGSSAGQIVFSVNTAASNTETQIIFTATATTLYLVLGVGLNSGTANLDGYFDNISVRELPGNHAYQTTATSRPVLSARYNLLTKTEQFDDGVWTRGSPARVTITANATTAPDGTSTADLMTETVENSTHRVVFEAVASSSVLVNNTLSCRFKPNTGNPFALLLITDSTGNNQVRAWFNLATGAVGTIQNIGAGSATSATIAADAQGFYRCAVSGLVGGTGTCYAFVGMANADAALSYVGDTGRSVYIWGASLVPANQSSLPYQRVNTATDYDSDPAKFKPYLRFDGIDDWMVTNTITPGIDKVQVFAGVRKLDVSSNRCLAELSANLNSNNGSFALFAFGQAVDDWYYGSKGTALSSANALRPTPSTAAITAISDIFGDRTVLRINGAQAASSTADQGTGNFLAYPLYIGRRGGTTLPFNGHLYSLIVRFGSNLPIATIEKVENYVEMKTFGKDMNYVYQDEVLSADNEQITSADGQNIYMSFSYQ